MRMYSGQNKEPGHPSVFSLTAHLSLCLTCRLQVQKTISTTAVSRLLSRLSFAFHFVAPIACYQNTPSSRKLSFFFSIDDPLFSLPIHHRTAVVYFFLSFYTFVSVGS